MQIRKNQNCSGLRNDRFEKKLAYTFIKIEFNKQLCSLNNLSYNWTSLVVCWGWFEQTMKSMIQEPQSRNSWYRIFGEFQGNVKLLLYISYVYIFVWSWEYPVFKLLIDCLFKGISSLARTSERSLVTSDPGATGKFSGILLEIQWNSTGNQWKFTGNQWKFTGNQLNFTEWPVPEIPSGTWVTGAS